MAKISSKHIAIDKANTQMVIIVAAAAFVTVFSLVAARALWSVNRYQANITSEKEKAHHQLVDNIKAFSSLSKLYESFDGADKNIIGGNKDGGGDNDGKNSKIILDALPSTYDFPALASSLEKIVNDQHLKVGGINGIDDQVAQQENTSSASPQPATMPFSLSLTDANYQNVQQFIDTLGRSIRPMQINSMDIAGDATKMTVSITAQSYYQPAKNLNITTKVVK